MTSFNQLLRSLHGSMDLRFQWSDFNLLLLSISVPANANIIGYQGKMIYHFNSVQSLSHVWLFMTPWTAARQDSLSITNSWSLLKLMSIVLVMPSNHHPLSSPSPLAFNLPGSGSFQMSLFFASGVQNIGVSSSASVLPVNIQNWFPLGWTSCISLLSKGFSRVFSNTTVQKIYH